MPPPLPGIFLARIPVGGFSVAIQVWVGNWSGCERRWGWFWRLSCFPGRAGGSFGVLCVCVWGSCCTPIVTCRLRKPTRRGVRRPRKTPLGASPLGRTRAGHLGVDRQGPSRLGERKGVSDARHYSHAHALAFARSHSLKHTHTHTHTSCHIPPSSLVCIPTPFVHGVLWYEGRV